MALIKRIFKWSEKQFTAFTIYSVGKKVRISPVDFNHVFINLTFYSKCLSVMRLFALICGLSNSSLNFTGET